MKRNLKGLINLSELTKTADSDLFGRPLPAGSRAIALIPILRARSMVGTDLSRSGRSGSGYGSSSGQATAPSRGRRKGRVISHNWTVTPHTSATPPTPAHHKTTTGSGSGSIDVAGGIKNTASTLSSFAGLLRTLNGE